LKTETLAAPNASRQRAHPSPPTLIVTPVGSAIIVVVPTAACLVRRHGLARSPSLELKWRRPRARKYGLFPRRFGPTRTALSAHGVVARRLAAEHNGCTWMQSMVRCATFGLVLMVVLAGCASQSASALRSARRTQAFSEEQKLLACLDLRDHIVELYANDYVSREGLSLSRQERSAFRDGWAEELAKRGTFDRFEQSCSYSLTPSKYRCGMASQTTDGLVACMKLGSG
jgi:hypothetical protein